MRVDRPISLHTVRPEFLYRLGLAFVGILALLLREWFVLVTVVEAPIRGDIVEYVAYAKNLLTHGVFSHAPAGPLAPAPDAWRSPGYPLFLALTLYFGGGDYYWYATAVQLQVVLGTATCVVTSACARFWLPRGWALLPGGLMSIWPHHIAATGALLSEVILGFCLVLAVWLSLLAVTRYSKTSAVGAGITFAYAGLVNPLASPLALLTGIIVWRTTSPRLGAWMLALPLALSLGWQVRSAVSVDTPPGAPNRGLVNLVQGSWPEYHDARNQSHLHEIPAAIMQAIADEERLICTDLGAGLEAMLDRMEEAPLDYLQWYLLEKPWLLWAWDIRMGAGDVYFHRVRQSPLETSPFLHTTKRFAKTINPYLFAVATATTVFVLCGWFRPRRRPAISLALVAFAFLWFTAAHSLLQAEPRYANAYRPFEMMLAATFFAATITFARARWQGRRARAAQISHRPNNPDSAASRVRDSVASRAIASSRTARFIQKIGALVYRDERTRREGLGLLMT